MSENWSDVDAELVATMAQRNSQVSEDLPFRVALLGDWGGRANRGLFASSDQLANWRPILVDRDNLDQVMARLGVGLSLSLADNDSQSLTVNFSQLADFHPDRLFKQLDVFETLRQTRANLSNPKTFSEAALTVRKWTTSTAVLPATKALHAEAVSEPSLEAPVEIRDSLARSDGRLLDQILESTSVGSQPASPKSSQSGSSSISPEISALAREAVKPYLTADNEAEREQLTAVVDARIARQINSILHHPDFQALESAWRALDFLVTRLETGTELKLYLLDISFEELKSDLRSNEDFRTTALYKLLAEQTVGTAGGIPWAFVCGNYTFDFASSDPGLIERLSLIAREAGAPFVGAATPQLLGCQSFIETPDPDDWPEELDPQIEQWWKSLTSIPSAAYVGFALPRFLLRLPYGKATEPTEEFDFEEMPESEETAVSVPIRHESYLWANPAFAVAFLMAKGFNEDGWNFRPSDFPEIEGLPLHIYEHDGDTEIKPCAEILLTLRAAERIINRGLMPLLSMKESDTVRLGMVQSIARTKLAGPWNEH